MTDMKDKKPEKAEQAEPKQESNEFELNEKQKLKRDIALAESRQKQALAERKKLGKGIAVGMVAEDARDAMARRLVPEAFIHEQKKFAPGEVRKSLSDYKVGSELSTAYCENDEKEHKKMMAQAWIPVTDEHGQHATEPRGDRLYKRDIIFERDQQEGSVKHGAAELEAEANNMKAKAPFKGDVSDKITVSKQ